MTAKFVLGNTSRARLSGVHPVLVGVVKRAIEITSQDFTVYEGLRTLDRQKKLVAAGASKTLKSLHLKQADGFGHAVDLVPWIDGTPRWEWEPCYRIAQAVDQATTELGVAGNICWGGVWDRYLSQYGGSDASMRAEVQAYCIRHPGPDFIDGPHYQIGRLG